MHILFRNESAAGFSGSEWCAPPFQQILQLAQSGEEGGNLVLGKAGEGAEFLYRYKAVFILLEFFAYKNYYALGSSQAASCDVYNVFCVNDNSVRNGIHQNMDWNGKVCLVFCTGTEKKGL
jgi:hypothetical protein